MGTQVNAVRILITGAGFSKAWGLPLTNELAQAMQQTLSAIPTAEIGPTAGHLIAFLSELQRVRGPKPDLEEVLTVMREGMDEEYESGWEDRTALVWDALGLNPDNLWHVPMFGVADPAYHYYALQWGLAATLNWTGWDAPPDGLVRRWFGIPRAYARLMEEHGPFDAVISLNYDVVPEYMFFGPIDYGFDDPTILDVIDHVDDFHRAANGQWVSKIIAEPRTQFPGGMLVLKLHGSTNMAFCPSCERVLLYPRRLPGGREPAEQFAWTATAAYQCTLHCGALDEAAPSLSPGRMQPLMVPPLNNKTALPQWKVLGPIQKRAVEAASSASEVVLVGASLRPSDDALTQVMKALSCDVKLIGGDEARTRLSELGIPFTHIRKYLDEGEQDRTELVVNKRRVTFETVPRPGRFGREDASGAVARSLWESLPSVEAQKTYLAIRMGCWPERGKPRDVFGHLPWMDRLVGTEERRMRIPEGLREWVADRIALANAGARDIPGRVRFFMDNGAWIGHVYGP